MNEIRISYFEMMHIHSEYDLKCLLKKKGLPMTGLTNLKLDEEYEYTRFEDWKAYETIYRWRRK